MRSLFVLLIITALTNKSWGEFYLDASRCEFGKIIYGASITGGSDDYISEEFVELNEGDVLYVLTCAIKHTAGQSRYRTFNPETGNGGSGGTSSIQIGIFTKDANDVGYSSIIPFMGGYGSEYLTNAQTGRYIVGPTKVYIGLPFITDLTSNNYFTEYQSSYTYSFECSFHYAIQRKRVVNPQVVNN